MTKQDNWTDGCGWFVLIVGILFLLFFGGVYFLDKYGIVKNMTTTTTWIITGILICMILGCLYFVYKI